LLATRERGRKRVSAKVAREARRREGQPLLLKPDRVWEAQRVAPVKIALGTPAQHQLVSRPHYYRERLKRIFNGYYHPMYNHHMINTKF
jgi:hypothetical protein